MHAVFNTVRVSHPCVDIYWKVVVLRCAGQSVLGVTPGVTPRLYNTVVGGIHDIIVPVRDCVGDTVLWMVRWRCVLVSRRRRRQSSTTRRTWRRHSRRWKSRARACRETSRPFGPGGQGEATQFSLLSMLRIQCGGGGRGGGARL